MTQQRTVINKGKRLLVNCPSIDDGVGAGFATGQLVMKSMTDGKWYVVTASGSAGNVQLFVSQSALPFKSGQIRFQTVVRFPTEKRPSTCRASTLYPEHPKEGVKSPCNRFKCPHRARSEPL